jgi:DNA-binding transcriptional regulator LsrR (DeoR family)
MSRRPHHKIAKLRAEALRLFLFEDQDCKTIARILGVSRRTACRYIQDAKAWPEVPPPRRECIQALVVNAKGRAKPEDLYNHHSHTVGTIFSSLTSAQRRVYTLYFEKGLNAREISELECKSRSAITRRVSRIRARFIEIGLPAPRHVAEGRRQAALSYPISLDAFPPGLI